MLIEKITWVCPICHKEYDIKAQAMDCRESHIRIISYSPQFGSPGHIPSHVVVHMSDNTAFKYKREE